MEMKKEEEIILRWNRNEYDERIKMKNENNMEKDITGDKNVIG